MQAPIEAARAGGPDDGSMPTETVADTPAEAPREASGAPTPAEATDATEAEEALDPADLPEGLDDVLDPPEPVAARQPEARAAGAPTAEARTADPLPRGHRVEATPEAAEATPEAPLPPSRSDDGVVRVTLDADLAVEVATEGESVDVTLEGTEASTRDLDDLGPELEQALARDGWDLRRFRRRTPDPLPAGGPRRGTSATDDTPDEPAPRRIRRGSLVDVLA